MGIEYFFFNGGKDVIVWETSGLGVKGSGFPDPTWWNDYPAMVDVDGLLQRMYQDVIYRAQPVLEAYPEPPDRIGLRTVVGDPRCILGGLIESSSDKDWIDLQLKEVLLGGKDSRKGTLISRILDTIVEDKVRLVAFHPVFPSQLCRVFRESAQEEIARQSFTKELTDPEWAHTREDVKKDRPSFVVPQDTVTLSAVASSFEDGVQVTFNIVRVIKDGTKEQVESVGTVSGIVRQEFVTSSTWTVPSTPGEVTLSKQVGYRFHATAEGYRTETRDIPLPQGLEVWLELDPLAPHPLDDALDLREEGGESVGAIDVSKAPDAAHGYKVLFLPMRKDTQYNLVRWVGPGSDDFDYLIDAMTPQDLLALGEDPPRIETVFLLNGAMDPGQVLSALDAASQDTEASSDAPRILPSSAVAGVKTLNAVTHRFFFLGPRGTSLSASPGGRETDQLTLVAADDHGRLCYVDEHFHPSAFGVQRPVGYRLLEMEPVAPGMARYAYFFADKDWQKKLLDFTDSIDYTSGRFKALPVMVNETLVKTRGDERETFRKTCQLRWPRGEPTRDGPPVTRYVFPKIQYVFLVIPEHALSLESGENVAGEEENAIPPMKWWKAGEDRAHAVPIAGRYQELTWTLRIGKADVTRKFLVYVVMTGSEAIEDSGLYRVSVPLSIFSARIQRWANERNEPDILTSVRVNFDISTMMSDISFHVLEPVSIERALVTAFPDEYADIMYRVFEEEEGTPEFKFDAKHPVRTFFERMDLLRTKQKTVTEAFGAWKEFGTGLGERTSEKDSAGNGKSWKGVAKPAGDAADKTLKVVSLFVEDEDTKRILGSVSKIYSGITTSVDLVEKWNRLVRGKRHLVKEERFLWQNIQKIYDLSEGTVSERLWHAWSWNKWATNQLRNEKLPDEKALKLGTLRNDDEIGALITDGLPRPDIAVAEGEKVKELAKIYDTGAKKFLSVVDVGLVAVDAALRVYTLWKAWEELDRAENALHLQDGRLNVTTQEWVRQWTSKTNGSVAPEWQQLEYLAGQIRLVETLRVKVEEKARALLKEASLLVLDGLQLVPVVGVLAMTVSLGLDAVAAASDIISGSVGLLDRFVFEKKLKAWWDMHEHRVALRKRARAIHQGMVRRLASVQSKSDPADDPVFQAYLREEALLGLVVIVSRLGSRIGNPEEFERKVAQYKVEEYIETWLGPDPAVYYSVIVNLDTSFASSDLDLGTDWLYRVGNKNPNDNEEIPKRPRESDSGTQEKRTITGTEFLTGPWGGGDGEVIPYSGDLPEVVSGPLLRE